MKHPSLFLSVGALILVLAPAAYAEGNVDKGRALAEQHCSRCHVVGGFNPMGGIGSTPSLQWLKRLGDWRDRFQTFYVRRPHPAFVRVEGAPPPSNAPAYAEPIEISLDQAADIFAFVETLAVPGDTFIPRSQRLRQ